MFKKAIKKNLEYTRPVFFGERLFGSNKVNSGIGTFIVLNDEGYILTCKHIAEKIIMARELEIKYNSYLEKTASKSAKEIEKINKEYNYENNTIVQAKNVFMNCFEEGILEKIILHKDYDLALLKFSHFKKVNVSSFPIFTTKDIEAGESICKLGFPWPSYDCFLLNERTNTIEIKENASFETPAFPFDGMITRLMVDPKGHNPRKRSISSPSAT